MKPSDHIFPGALCCICKVDDAKVLTRLVARDDDMPADGILWGAATCWDCANMLARSLVASASIVEAPDPGTAPTIPMPVPAYTCEWCHAVVYTTDESIVCPNCGKERPS